MKKESKNPYQVLGINEKASQDEIKTAYRKLYRQFNTAGITDPMEIKKREALLIEINQAYDLINSDEKKAAYDRKDDGGFSSNFSGNFDGFDIKFGNGFGGGSNLEDILNMFGFNSYKKSNTQRESNSVKIILTPNDFKSENFVFEIDGKTEKCIYCNGTKICKSCNSFFKISCKICRGSKLCIECNGKGFKSKNKKRYQISLFDIARAKDKRIMLDDGTVVVFDFKE